MTKYDDLVAVLRVVGDHEAAKDPAKGCNPCNVNGLAEAMDLEPQEVADRLAVLYLGKMVAVRPASEMDRQIAVDLMTTGASSRQSAAAQDGEGG